MIVYILLLHFKQEIQDDENSIKPTKTQENTSRNNMSIRTPNCGIVTLLGNQLKLFWKIGVHWLKAVKNMLLLPLNTERIKMLNTV